MLLVGLAVLAILTGCVSYENRRWFGGQRTIQLENGTKVSLWLRPSSSDLDVPLVAATFHKSPPPYTLQVFFPQPNKSYRFIEIDGVAIRYSSGMEEEGSGKLRREITSRQRKDGIVLWDPPLKDVVTRHEDCTISLTGRFITSHGKVIPFVVTEEFKAEGRKTDVIPYWKSGP